MGLNFQCGAGASSANEEKDITEVKEYLPWRGEVTT